MEAARATGTSPSIAHFKAQRSGLDKDCGIAADEDDAPALASMGVDVGHRRIHVWVAEWRGAPGAST